MMRQWPWIPGLLVLWLALPAAPAGDRHQTAELAARQRDFARAAEVWEELAREGDAKAAYRLSGLYRSGRGVARDLERAKHWLEHAERSGHEAAAETPVLRTTRFRNTDPERDLREAIERGDLQATQRAILGGALPDRRGAEGRCPVAEAILRGHVPILRLLLAAGADPERCPGSDRSFLLDAIESGEADAVVALLRAGARWQRSGSGRSTALHAAARLGDRTMVDVLIRAGHPLDDRDAAGRTPLDVARVTQQAATAQALRAAGARETPTEAGGGQARPEWLVAAARDTTARIEGDWPVLSLAAWRGQQAVVEGLLAEGHASDEPDPEGWAPIARAASAGHLEIVQLLLRAGADPNAGGVPALVAASSTQGVRLARALLTAGAAVQGVDPAGGTPLHHAAGRGEAGLVALLLDGGAAAEAFDGAGELALDRAIRSGHSELVPVLAAGLGADLRLRAACRAVRGGAGEPVESLLGAGEAGAMPCDDGQYLLHLLAQRGRLAAVERLLERGAPSDPRNPSGNTPLLLAAWAGHAEVAASLIGHGAAVDARDARGRTPLLRAAAAGHLATVEVLMAAGADRWIRSHRGETALEAARRLERPEVETALAARSPGGWLP